MSARRKRILTRAGLAAVIVAITALAIFAAVGGGGNVARTTTAPRITAVIGPAPVASAAVGGSALTVAAYRRQAQAICSALSLTAPSGTASLQQAAPVLARDVAQTSGALGRLRALRPPSSITSQVNDALGITQQVVEVGGELASAAQVGDLTSVTNDYEQLEGLAVAEHGVWTQIGVSGC